MKNIYIVSLKYSAGLFKEILCLKDCFLESGFNVNTVLHHHYRNVQTLDKGLKSNSFFSGFKTALNIANEVAKSKPNIIFFYNSHPLNFLYLILGMLFFSRSRRVLVLHEPNKKRIFKNYGYHGFFVLLITIFNKCQSWLCTDIVVLSPYAEKLYNESIGYNPFCRVHQARILLPPLELDRDTDPGKISFIGNINSTKGVGWFLDLAEHASLKSPSLKFAIVTGSTLQESVKDRVCSLQNNLALYNPKILYDDEISSCLRKSSLVFCLHKSVTQSGVFVECMRHGVPTIVLNEAGFTQFLDGSGVSVTGSSNYNEILSAINTIFLARDKFTVAAKKNYNENFDARLFPIFYASFINDL